MKRAGWGATPASAIAASVWLLQFGLAFGLLNGLLSFENRWPGFGIQATPRLSFELCLALAALAGWVAWRGSPGPRAASGLALCFVLLVAVRYVDVTAPAVLGRPVNLYWDGRHGLELVQVAMGSMPQWQGATVGIVFVAGLALLIAAVRLAIVTLARCLTWEAPRPVILAAVGALAISFAAYVPGGRDTRWFFSLPLTPTLQQQALLMTRVLWPAHGEKVLGEGPSFETSLDGLKGAEGAADVLVVFAESYGASAFDQPVLSAALAEPRAALMRALVVNGLGVVSARARSPTFGGASWLAHASFLSGLPMSDPGHHDLLLASRRPTLVSHFARHGYRTVGWMPGIKRAWPEGAFYGYERIANDPGMGYEGPDFGYWRIPDQFSMARLHEQELAAAAPEQVLRQPRFVVFATISTHAPFQPLAPYVEDWGTLNRPDAYKATDAAAAQAVPLALQQALPNYVESLRYQFQWVTGFLQQPADRPLVMVLIGDHQPPGGVAGRGASWDVPVHVFSQDPALLDRLQARGFARGLFPPDGSLGPMHGLTGLLLEAFDQTGPSDPKTEGLRPAPQRRDADATATCQACTSPEGASAGRPISQARMTSAVMP